MTVAYKTRLDRFTLIENELSNHGCKQQGLTAKEILSRLTDSAEPLIALRTLQRDLEELRKNGVVTRRNEPGMSPRYAIVSQDQEFDALAWEYTLAQVKEQMQDLMSSAQLQALLSKLVGDEAGNVLDESKLRIIPDTMRLKPASIHGTILTSVLAALAKEQVLQLVYRDREGKTTQSFLHPQGLLQRGPLVYLFALKNEEQEVRMYALHRMIKVEIVSEVARKAENFDLEQSLYNGQADFSAGEPIQLEAMVRGYVTDLLRDCPLNESQTILDCPEDSEFEAHLSVCLPDSGQLLRWLLGCGDNLKVLGPDFVRYRMRAQSRKMAALYD